MTSSTTNPFEVRRIPGKVRPSSSPCPLTTQVGHCRGDAGWVLFWACRAPGWGTLGRRGYFPLKLGETIVVTRLGPRSRPFEAFSLSPAPRRSDIAWRLPSDVVRRRGVAEKQRSQEVCPKPFPEAYRSDFSHGPRASCVGVMGDGRARDEKPTAQTTRCCIFGGLSAHRRNCRNRYIDSSKSGTNPAGTVVRGAPALAAAFNTLDLLGCRSEIIASD